MTDKQKDKNQDHERFKKDQEKAKEAEKVSGDNESKTKNDTKKEVTSADKNPSKSKEKDSALLQKTVDPSDKQNKKTIMIVVGVVVAVIVLCCLTIVCGIVISNTISSEREEESTNIEDERMEERRERNRREIDTETEPTVEPEGEVDMKNKDSESYTQEDALNSDKFDYERTSVTIDDDPIMGSVYTADVVMVEFSDLECPFCKRHHEQTHPKIVENFVETGELAIVYRDFPLTFHEPTASDKANAAECVRSLSDDETYFEYINILFNDSDQGNFVTSEELADYAVDVGINYSEALSCIENDVFDQEIEQDISDGQDAGITGTPGFVIGYMDGNGLVEGYIVAGAYPYSAFEDLITYLAEAR